MSAERTGAHVVALPTATMQPITNRRHRGPYPAGVVPAWRLTVLRRDRELAAATAAVSKAIPAEGESLSTMEGKLFCCEMGARMLLDSVERLRAALREQETREAPPR